MRKSSSGDNRHPYLKTHNWESKLAFWENDLYSEKSKDYFRQRLAEWQARERNIKPNLIIGEKRITFD